MNGTRVKSKNIRHIACWMCLGCLLYQPVRAATPVHLLGFVERMCRGETYCLDLRVEPPYVAQVGKTIRVRFAGAAQIYDPENYELTLEQQQIVPGSHLRLLIFADDVPGEYRARYIWIGD